MKLDHTLPFDSGEAEAFLAALPREPAVFALWPHLDPTPGTQPYLSRTRNLRHRLERLLATPRPGLRRLNLREFTCRVDFQTVGSSFEAAWLTYELNREHYPRVYRQRLRLKPPALLKVNLANRFPRCYATRRLARDGSLYYGPFPSRVEAERFAGEFLDFFKIRRCIEDLDPNPSHPGCIYSQMRMCLAPCYAGCTDAEYQQELGRAVRFLNTQGSSLVREFEAERERASDSLDFEQAARLHQRLEKLNDALRRRPDLAKKVTDLHAIILERGADPGSVVLFRVWAGELFGPATLSLDERVASPASLDRQLQTLLDSLRPRLEPGRHAGAPAATPATAAARSDAPASTSSAELRASSDSRSPSSTPQPLPPWEHLAILARWYYSSFREGEFVMLNRAEEIPHARLIRSCRKLTTSQAP
jgi:excinuclease UvrABC nuclease subunit